jgi:hypothetical protein
MFLVLLISCDTSNKSEQKNIKQKTYFLKHGFKNEKILFINDSIYEHIVEEIDFKESNNYKIEGNNLYLKKYTTIIDWENGNVINNPQKGTWSLNIKNDILSSGLEQTDLISEENWDVECKCEK